MWLLYPSFADVSEGRSRLFALIIVHNAAMIQQVRKQCICMMHDRRRKQFDARTVCFQIEHFQIGASNG